MTEKRNNLRSNEPSGLVSIKNSGPVRLWRKIQINEWTFSLFLFLASLSIVLGKLFINYGNMLQWQGNKHTIPSISSVFTKAEDTWATPAIPEFSVKKLAVTSEKFVNISNQYEAVVADTVTSFYKSYGWLIRAAISGLVMTGFSWFIIYKDSSIPGINPPSPFSPSKHRIPELPGIQMNYLVGLLNGMLIFVYMCM